MEVQSQRTSDSTQATPPHATPEGTVQRLTQLETSLQSLECRISALENRQKNNSEDQENNKPINPVKRLPDSTSNQVNTLILSDISLRNVKVSDLSNNSAIKTLYEANFDLLKCWIHEKLTWTPDRCIIYGGLYDTLEGKAPTETIDHLSALISELKSKNKNMELCVIQIAPTLQSDSLQAKINEINDHIQKWADDNGIITVNPSLSFRLGTGDIDESCFSTTHLNRIGITRLFNAITKKYPAFKECINWEQLKKNSGTQSSWYTDNPSHSSPHTPNTLPRDQEGWQEVNRRSTRRPRAQQQG